MRPFRWTRLNKALRVIIQKDGACEAKRLMRQNRTEVAKRQKWRDAELAMTIAADERLIDDIAQRLGVN